MNKEQKIISKYMARLGEKGGKANIDKNGKERMKKIGKLGGLAKRKSALNKSIDKYLENATDIMK